MKTKSIALAVLLATASIAQADNVITMTQINEYPDVLTKEYFDNQGVVILDSFRLPLLSMAKLGLTPTPSDAILMAFLPSSYMGERAFQHDEDYVRDGVSRAYFTTSIDFRIKNPSEARRLNESVAAWLPAEIDVIKSAPYYSVSVDADKVIREAIDDNTFLLTIQAGAHFRQELKSRFRCAGVIPGPVSKVGGYRQLAPTCVEFKTWQFKLKLDTTTIDQLATNSNIGAMIECDLSGKAKQLDSRGRELKFSRNSEESVSAGVCTPRRIYLTDGIQHVYAAAQISGLGE